MTTLIGVLLATLATTASLHAAVFNPPVSDYTRTLWTERDGLPSNQILSIAQDRDGFLWLATTAGLVRFDGNRFVLRGLGDRPTLPVRTLLFARDGGLWFAFHDSPRVGRIQSGQLLTYDGLPGQVFALMESRDGTIWAGGRGGLSIFKDGRWERLEQRFGAPEPAVDGLFEDRRGNVFVGTSRGIYRRAAETDFFDLVLPTLSPAAHDFVETAAGEVLVNDPQRLVKRLTEDDAVNRKIAASGVAQGLHLLYDVHRTLWIATRENGLLRLSDYPKGPIERVTADNSIRCLFEDREGNIWMATGEGLVRLSKVRITSLTPANRSGDQFVRAVAMAKDGTVWTGTADGLVRFSDGHQKVYSSRDGLASPVVTALHGGDDGSIWIGTDRGLARYLNGHFASISLPGRPAPSQILSITADREGAVWASDIQGLFRWTDGQLTSFDEVRGPVYAAYADRRGRLWFGTSEGEVAVYEQGRLRAYYEKDGLAAAPVIGIFEDTRGVVWVATTVGISRFENNRFTTLLQKRGIPGNLVIAFAIDRDDYLWLGINFGIVRLHQQEFDRAVADESYQIQYVFYDASDGLLGTPRYVGYPNVVRANDGTLWFATTAGLSLVDPRHFQETRSAPPVIVEAVIVDGRELGPRPSVRLPPSTSKLEVSYTAPAVGAATKVRFRHMLEGFEKQWVTDDPYQRALYTNLYPGSYRLRISASYGNGVWTDPGAVWDFSVEPRFYQTRWFYAACAGVLSLALWTAWQVRSRRVQRQFSMVLAERARMGREIHDTLLQSLVGTALQLDNISTELDSAPDSAKQQLLKIRREVERYVGEANQSIWDLRSPMLNRLDLAAALQEAAENILASTGIAFQFAATGPRRPCPPAIEQQLLRIAREAVTNAVRHGHASRIQMELSYDAKSVSVRVSDNGCGFDSTAIGRDREGHWGLSIMQERTQQIGGRLNLVSAPNGGTTIEVVAPCSGTKSEL
jgi:signal transduction histidine kinase/ligand-binding sensor domain-containing protein